ncbi:MAG: GIY-YIG nuclease family protein [Synergistaceae bacterium]|jgi:putative endonuclease|nr:GIY-YIG nuclease family protein [Synergistaceae bacterium]
MSAKFYVYILRCADGTCYTGFTHDLEHRLKAHNEGAGGAKYTRARRPVELVYFEEHDSTSSALKRERQIKRLSRAAKLALIAGIQNA